MKKEENSIGELRQDSITGKWVVVAKSRAKRPDELGEEHQPVRLRRYKEDCPFCNLAEFPQEPDVLRLPDDPEKWQVHIFGNKFPAFVPRDEFRTWQEGPYSALEAVGYHELLATRWHDQSETNMTLNELSLALEALVLRYRSLREKPGVNYIQVIRNYGEGGGASLEHPHHQIFTTPVLPSDISDLLHGAKAYADEHDEDGFTALLQFERAEGERIVWENEYFTAFCPFAPRFAFEVWIMPRAHESYFENTGPEAREALAEVLSQVLKRLSIGLNDPPLNYFIYSAPCDETGFTCDASMFETFRWHIQVTPRLSKFGGFEIGTGLEIVAAVPEESAAYLRDVNITS